MKLNPLHIHAARVYVRYWKTRLSYGSCSLTISLEKTVCVPLSQALEETFLRARESGRETPDNSFAGLPETSGVRSIGAHLLETFVNGVTEHIPLPTKRSYMARENR